MSFSKLFSKRNINKVLSIITVFVMIISSSHLIEASSIGGSSIGGSSIGGSSIGGSSIGGSSIGGSSIGGSSIGGSSIGGSSIGGSSIGGSSIGGSSIGGSSIGGSSIGGSSIGGSSIGGSSIGGSSIGGSSIGGSSIGGSSIGGSSIGGSSIGGSSIGGGGGNDDRDPGITVVRAPAPSCTLHVNPGSITKGQSATITWTTQNAVSARLTMPRGTENVNLRNDQRIIKPHNNFTLRLVVKNRDGQERSCTAQIRVTEPTPAPTCTISASPTTINWGEGSTVTWTTQNADTVVLERPHGPQSQQKNGSLRVTPWTTFTFVLTATNSAGDSVRCPVTVTVKQPSPPTCTISAHPSTITRGASSQLKWTTHNAESARINQNIGEVQTGNNRSRNVSPHNTTTYTMTVVNARGVEATCRTTVTVKQPTPAPSCDISAYPSTINKGSSSTLKWNTTNATKASIQGIGNVAVGANKSRSVSPHTTTTYVMTVENAEGRKGTCRTTVTVKQPTPAPSCVLTINPSTIVRGETAVVTWTTQNAVSARLTIPRGTEDVNLTNDQRTIWPTNDAEARMVVKSSDGREGTCRAEIKVTQPTPVPTCENNVDFTASPSRIDRGDSSTLRWSTTGGLTNVRINQGIGSVANNGEFTVTPTSNTTYTLTASKDDTTINCPVTVEVESTTTGGGGGGTITPRCTLNVTRNNITRGESTTLSWSGRNVADIEITDNRGNVIVTTKDRLSTDKSSLFSGSQTVRPTQTTTYTMVAERGSRTDECQVRVTVEQEETQIVVIEDRTQQPLVSGIALTQVPHTGFEAGPFLTMLFYTTLVLWALFVAYVYMRRRQPEFITEQVVNNGMYQGSQFSPFTPVSVQDTNHYTAQSMAVPQNLPTMPEMQWSAHTPVAEVLNVDVDVLETIAHQNNVLVSRDVLEKFIELTVNTDQVQRFNIFLNELKREYQAEDGWVVANLPRMYALMQN